VSWLRRAAHALVLEHYRWEAVGQVWRALFPPERFPAAEAVPRPPPDGRLSPDADAAAVTLATVVSVAGSSSRRREPTTGSAQR
jgi:hypothetical protein